MRIITMIVMLIGVVSLVFGILFITQAGSAEQEIADSIQPLKLSEVDARYDTVKANHMAMRMAEEPDIQAGKAAPSATYNYLTIQRTSLGLTRSQIGLVSFTRTSGIINIILGAGLILAGVVLIKKA